MSSNKDNKEKFTEDNKEIFTEDGEIVSSEEKNTDDENENLIEIIGGEIEYPEERVSLTDAIKYAFDLDEETSEERVVENADDEVVFVAPDRIMNYIEDYLNNVDDESDNTQNVEFVSTNTMYFSTGETDSLPSVRIDDNTGEIVAVSDISKQADSESTAEGLIEETSVDEISEETETESDIELQADVEQAAQPEEIEEPAELSEEDETSDEPEFGDESEQDISENEAETVFEEAESEAEEEKSVEENAEDTVENEETDEAEEVDLFEIADMPVETDDDSDEAEDSFADDGIDGINDEQDNENGEDEIPAIFTQGSAVASNISDDRADDEGEQSESGVEDESENAPDIKTEDPENATAITVHRHRDNAPENESEESEVSEYEEMFGTEDALDEAEEKPSFFQRHSISAWAKKKTAGGWTKFALKCVGVLLLVLCVTAVLYVNGKLDLINYKDADDFEQYYNLSDTDYVSSSDEVYENPVHYNSSTTLEGFDESMIDIDKEDVINVLLIGTDVRGGTYEDRGNTDSMILLSINTRDKNIKLTSFMRDMYVTIPGRGKNRINAAYAYGGPQLLFDTLKTNFDVDVDLYARVNFANFRKIIDQVGGIEIELTQAEANYMNKYSQKYNTDRVEAGLQTLDGAQALSYARCRKIDSDFGRTERQRKVLVAFVDKIKGSSLTELDSLLNTLLPMIQTNMPKMQIVSLMVDALSYLNNEVETLNIPIKNSWRSVTIRQMSVICPNFELNKTAIVAHIYSTYKLDVENTMYQSFEVPKGDTTTKRKTTTTASTTAPSVAEETTTTTESTESTQSSTTTKKTYWWERTTTSSTTTTQASQSTTTAAPSSTTAAPSQSQSANNEAA